MLREENVIQTILEYAIDGYKRPKKLKFQPDRKNGRKIFEKIYKKLPIEFHAEAENLKKEQRIFEKIYKKFPIDFATDSINENWKFIFQ